MTNPIDKGLRLPTDVHRLFNRALPVVDPDSLEVLFDDDLPATPTAIRPGGGVRRPRDKGTASTDKRCRGIFAGPT